MSYRQLLGDLDEWFAQGVASAGHDVVLCRRGCSACCNGPFDISPADAQMISAAVDRLPADIAAQVRARAQEQIATYHEAAPWWQSPWDVDILDEEYFDRFGLQLAHHPCPALGDDSGCVIYDNRPATCRMIGLSLVKPDGGVLDNDCPILHTSQKYAELNPVLFDLEQLELSADEFDAEAMAEGWVRTTVAGAIAR